jgi:anti-sigma B factor antagonist
LPETEYTCTMIGGVPVVAVPGEIDVTTVDQLRQVLVEAASSGHPTIVVDMTSTTFCDSSGLHALLIAHRRAVSEGGELRLAMPPGNPVNRIMTLTGLGGIMPRFPSLNEALAGQLAA